MTLNTRSRSCGRHRNSLKSAAVSCPPSGGFRAFSCSAPQGRRKVSVPFSVPRDVPKNRLRFGGKVAEQRRSRLQGPARASVVSQLAARLLCSRACRFFRSSVSCRFFLSFSGFVSLVRRGFAASSPIYIAPFSLKTFLSCQNRSERGGFEPRRGQGTGWPFQSAAPRARTRMPACVL